MGQGGHRRALALTPHPHNCVLYSPLPDTACSIPVEVNADGFESDDDKLKRMRAEWAKEAEWAGGGGPGSGRSGKRMEARMRDFDFAASDDAAVSKCADTVFSMMRREVRDQSHCCPRV